MATSCPSCKRVFSSDEDYRNHLPCHGSEVIGASGEKIKSESASQYAKEGGTGGGRP